LGLVLPNQYYAIIIENCDWKLGEFASWAHNPYNESLMQLMTASLTIQMVSVTPGHASLLLLTFLKQELIISVTLAMLRSITTIVQQLP